MRTLYLTTALAVGLFVNACSNSARGPKGAKWCTRSDDQVSLSDERASESTKLDDKATLSLNEGEYLLNSANLFIDDRERDIRLHVSLSIDKDGNTSPTLECVGSDSRQIKPGMDPFVYQFPIVRKLIVGPQGKTQLGEGVIELDYRDRGNSKWPQTRLIYDDSNKSDKSLSETNQGFSSATQYFLKVEGRYDMRSHLAEMKPNQRNSSEVLARRVQIQQSWAVKVDDPDPSLPSSPSGIGSGGGEAPTH